MMLWRYVHHCQLQTENAKAGQVVLDSAASHRRKSSFPALDTARPRPTRGHTSCFVHSLLESQKQNGSYTPKAEPNAEDGVDDRRKAKAPDADSDEAHTQSRLLTKKQLSEMAIGIRELSKKLSHVRLKLHVRNVFVLTKAYDETLIKYTREVSEWLLAKERDASYTV